MKSQKAGFTLIELMIVITLVGIIGTITTQVFLINVRSQNKSEIVKEVKQNGDYASAAMEIMIRNAIDVPSLQCNAQAADQLTITNQDGNSTTFDCSDDIKIASISSTFPSLPQSLTSSKVKVTGCFFKIICPTPPLSPKYVYMGFRVCQTGDDPCPGGTNFSVDTRASLEYETTVTLRNY
ncbi:type II secretion system protein [Candidatus Gottesmanbacteria bacterium]|nr:type II secretion system protein [Candidatus Gottesmanbacteria bacterium]